MKLLRITLLTLAAIVFSAVSLSAQEANTQIKKVYVVFKTHLDVGFTDYSSAVTKRYIEDFIPRAIDVSKRLEADGSGDRYVWTTGSWVVHRYFQTANAEQKAELEKAIKQGVIVWNAVPYTVETESMTFDLLNTCLMLSKKLDARFGKRTIAAKMTDVPGHTRSLVTALSDAGVEFLHIGVNPASPIPQVPDYCRWRDTNGKEIILAYQRDYGTENILPDGTTAVSINFTGDNHGPHSYDAVKNIYNSLRKRYPNAQIVAGSFNDIAAHLRSIKRKLPLVTSEIGDTWIYGYGSAPKRMAKFRALSRLYSKWLKEKKIKRNSLEAIDFAVELGLIAEHTQGMDIKTHLINWDKYDMDKFIAARSTEPFQRVEQSWREIDNYLYSAIEYLPASLQAEAKAELAKFDNIAVKNTNKVDKSVESAPMWSLGLFDDLLKVDGVTYTMYSATDFDDYLNRYLRARYGWALDDIGKTGLNQSHAVSAEIKAREVGSMTDGDTKVVNIKFPQQNGVDARVYPEAMQIESRVYDGGRKADIALTIINKPAVRLPEAYWISFVPQGLKQVIAEKVGKRVDLFDVVAKGNRHMHGIDRYVDMITDKGTIRVWSDEAFLINLGETNGLSYSTGYPDMKGGVHFCLSNNLWGTNFTMWNEGSLTYHFRVELLNE